MENKSFACAYTWAALWFAIAALVNFHSIINIDSGWILFEAARMLEGKRLYVDLLENNPPLIVWLFMLPAAVAGWLHVEVVAPFYLYVLLCCAGSLLLVAGELRRHPLFHAPRYGGIIFAVLAQALLAFSVHVFGQREHFFILLTLPYLVQSLLLDREPHWSARQWLIAVMAGIGFCIKPFFLVVWLAGEAWNAYALGKIRWLWRPTNMVIGGVAATYGAAIFFYTPEYMSFIVPAMLRVYAAYNSTLTGMSGPLLGLVLIYCLPALAILKHYNASRRLLAQLLVLTLAAALTVLAQHKGWLNHLYPLMFIGSMLLACVVIAACRQPGIPLNRRSFAALFASLFTLLFVPIYELSATYANQQHYKSFVTQLSGYISRYAKNKDACGLSPRLSANFSAFNYLDAHFPYRFPQLWMLPGILQATQDGRAAEVAPLRAFVLNTVTDDFLLHPPALVWIGSNDAVPIAAMHFDLLAFFLQDARFASLWKHYHKVGVITEDAGDDSTETYTMYARD